MKTEDLRNALNTLTEIENQILFDNINYHTALILLKLFPDNEIIKGLVEKKKAQNLYK